MTTQTILPADRESIIARAANCNEPAWMTELRLSALERAGQLELPKLDKTRIDRWKLDSYGKHSVSAPANNVSELPEAVQSLLSAEGSAQAGSVIVQRNSGTVFARLSAELAAQGVIFTDLETAAREHSDIVQSYFAKLVPADENRLTALHTALWNGGVFLYVPRNVVIDQPLQAMFVSDESDAAFAPHVLIVAEANSRVAYVDNYLSLGDHGGSLVQNGVVEVFVKPGAQVQFASVRSLDAATTDLIYRRAVVENDGRIEWTLGEMNDGTGMSDTVSILQGNGSSSDAKVICVGSGDQRLSITTKAIHHGRSTDSQMITRAVMRDAATAIVNGITKIEKGATKANGEQTEKVLMLSPKARGDANPILLIDEDDVTAGHAASVGQVNAEQVYYLMSRGISKAEAERLIIYGFLAPVIADIPVKEAEDQLRAFVERKLGQ